MRDYLLSSDLMRRPMHAHAIDACERHKISLDELKCARRFGRYVKARQEFSYNAHKDGASYPQIGRFLGGRDHTSIINLVRRYEARMGMLNGQ